MKQIALFILFAVVAFAPAKSFAQKLISNDVQFFDDYTGRTDSTTIKDLESQNRISKIRNYFILKRKEVHWKLMMIGMYIKIRMNPKKYIPLPPKRFPSPIPSY